MKQTLAYQSEVIDSVVDTAAQFFGVTGEEIKRHCREQPLCYFRHVAMYVAYLAAGTTLPDIGQVFNRDHTTVLHAVERVAQLIDDGDVETYVAVRSIVALLKGELISEAAE